MKSKKRDDKDRAKRLAGSVRLRVPAPKVIKDRKKADSKSACRKKK